MPSFRFKNGETINAETLEEARTMRSSSSGTAQPPPPFSGPQTSPLNMFKESKVQSKILGGAQSPTELLKLAAGIQTVTGSDKTLKDKFDVNQALNNILAMRVLKRRLEDLVSFKQKSDKSGRVGLFGSPTDTGPIAGRMWKATSGFTGTGEEKPIGLLSILMGSKYPKAQAERANLESAIKELQEIAFFKGGKQLTGREMAVTIGPLPSSYDDELPFYKKAERALTKTIPGTMQEQIKMLLDVGWSEDDVRPLLDMPDEEASVLYDTNRKKMNKKFEMEKK